MCYRKFLKSKINITVIIFVLSFVSFAQSTSKYKINLDNVKLKEIRCMAWSSDSEYLSFIYNYKLYLLSFSDVCTQEPDQNVKITGIVILDKVDEYTTKIIWSPDNKKIALLGEYLFSVIECDEIITNQTLNQNLRFKRVDLGKPIKDVKWSQSSNLIAAAFENNDIKIFSASDLKIIGEFSTGESPNVLLGWQGDNKIYYFSFRNMHNRYHLEETESLKNDKRGDIFGRYSFDYSLETLRMPIGIWSIDDNGKSEDVGEFSPRIRYSNIFKEGVSWKNVGKVHSFRYPSTILATYAEKSFHEVGFYFYDGIRIRQVIINLKNKYEDDGVIGCNYRNAIVTIMKFEKNPEKFILSSKGTRVAFINTYETEQDLGWGKKQKEEHIELWIGETEKKSDYTNAIFRPDGESPPIIIDESTSEEVTVTDKDGNEYQTVKIGNQYWITKNLNVNKFRNGDTIPLVKSMKEWKKACDAKQPACCYYKFKDKYGVVYGKMYNKYAIYDRRGLAPEGWRIPYDRDFNDAVLILEGDGIDINEAKEHFGGKLKETGTSNWKSPNSNATNQSGLSLLPGGVLKEIYNDTYKETYVRFDGVFESGHFCVKTDGRGIKYYSAYYKADYLFDNEVEKEYFGLYVRCIK